MKLKHLFMSVLAFAGILAVASCQQDDFVGGEVTGDYVDATFTVATPDGISTRAIGDGTTVNKLACAVYDANGKELEDLYKILPISGKQATFSTRLAKGQAYHVVFFAYNGDGNYYNVEDLKNIEVLGNQFSNVEKRDAFTRAYHISAEESMNAISKEIYLKRPLAQLNIGIDAEELNAAKEAGIEIEQSYVKVSSVYTCYNAFDSTVVGASTPVEFKMAAIPEGSFTVDSKEYKYLALNYLLVGDLGTEKTLTDVEFVWTSVDGKTNNPSTSFININTQRNYRTNIIGKLITNPTEFTVKIDERFDGEKNKIYTDVNGVQTAIVSTPQELQEAIEEAEEEGDYIIRLEDLFRSRAAETTVPEFTIVQKPGVNLTIDGCGTTFEGKFHINGSRRVSGESLTFKNINFRTTANEVYFIDAYKLYGNHYAHNVTVDGCTFEGNNTVVGVHVKQFYNIVVRNCTATGMHSLLQAQSSDSKITLDNVKAVNCKSGVSFGNTAYPTIINSNIEATGYGVRADGDQSRGNLVIKNTTINATYPVVIRKMTSNSYNVALEGTTLATTEKYEVIFTANKEEFVFELPTGKYTITGAEEYDVYPIINGVSNVDELVAAFANADVIELANDITLSENWVPVGTSEAPFTGLFDGKGYKISNLTVADTDYAAFIAYAGKNTTIKNVTFENVNIESTKHAAGVVCIAEEGLTIDGVTVNGTINAASYAGGLLHNATNATINNCENKANINASRAGGIASWVVSGAKISNVKNYGNITGRTAASGIAHGFGGSIKNAANYGNIKSENLEAAGGIAGVQKAVSTYEYCYNYGNVVSTFDDVNASAAGILGQTPGTSATFNYCANYGNVTAEQSYAAGIAYSLYGSINANYCYNAGEVNGADGAGAIAPKAAFGTGDKANYCLNAGVVASANGKVYQGANNNKECFYYSNGELLNVSNNSAASAEDALVLLNGGTNKNFFTTSNGEIVVK